MLRPLSFSSYDFICHFWLLHTVFLEINQLITKLQFCNVAVM